jgi:hypothetical protein
VELIVFVELKDALAVAPGIGARLACGRAVA